MKMNSFVKISALILSMGASSLYATMSMPYGWYVEGSAGSAKSHNISYPGSYNSSIGFSGNVDLGYKFMSYFAAEFGYSAYSNTVIRDQFNTKTATVRHYSYDLAGKGIVPVSFEGAELFAKLGVARINARITINNQTAANNIGLMGSNNNATGFFIGLGGSYYFRPEFAVNVEWQRVEGNSKTGNLDLYSVGLSYIFG